MKRWYVVYTRPGMERMAEGHLAAQGFDTYLPLRPKERRHARRTELVVVPLFPRYVFVGIDTTRERWRAVNGTYGVVNLVTFGERPAALPEAIMAGLRARARNDGLFDVADGPQFQAGEAVEITRGALAEQVGLFLRTDDKERVTLLLSLLGRETTVRLPADAVRAAG